MHHLISYESAMNCYGELTKLLSFVGYREEGGFPKKPFTTLEQGRFLMKPFTTLEQGRFLTKPFTTLERGRTNETIH